MNSTVRNKLQNQTSCRHDFSAPIGEGAFFDVCVPSTRFSSLDHITQAGWHMVNESYRISRPQGLPVNLMLLTVSGRGTVTLGGTKTAADPGSVVLIPSEMPSMYGCDAGSFWEFYWIHFTGNHAKDAVSDIVKDGNYVFYAGESLLTDMTTRLTGNDVRSAEREIDESEWLSDMLTLLLRKCVPDTENPREADRFGEILSYIENHLFDEPSLKKLADIFHYSEEHIIRVVKRRTGMSPVQYWIFQKLRHSCRDLELGMKSISEIAREHGYEFPSSYTNQFIKHFGMTPKQHRELYGIVLN